jgi:hypothetical protein
VLNIGLRVYVGTRSGGAVSHITEVAAHGQR